MHAQKFTGCLIAAATITAFLGSLFILPAHAVGQLESPVKIPAGPLMFDGPVEWSSEGSRSGPGETIMPGGIKINFAKMGINLFDMVFNVWTHRHRMTTEYVDSGREGSPRWLMTYRVDTIELFGNDVIGSTIVWITHDYRTGDGEITVVVTGSHDNKFNKPYRSRYSGGPTYQGPFPEPFPPTPPIDDSQGLNPDHSFELIKGLCLNNFNGLGSMIGESSLILDDPTPYWLEMSNAPQGYAFQNSETLNAVMYQLDDATAHGGFVVEVPGDAGPYFFAATGELLGHDRGVLSPYTVVFSFLVTWDAVIDVSQEISGTDAVQVTIIQDPDSPDQEVLGTFSLNREFDLPLGGTGIQVTDFAWGAGDLELRSQPFYEAMFGSWNYSRSQQVDGRLYENGRNSIFNFMLMNWLIDQPDMMDERPNWWDHLIGSLFDEEGILAYEDWLDFDSWWDERFFDDEQDEGWWQKFRDELRDWDWDPNAIA